MNSQITFMRESDDLLLFESKTRKTVSNLQEYATVPSCATNMLKLGTVTSWNEIKVLPFPPWNLSSENPHTNEANVRLFSLFGAYFLFILGAFFKERVWSSYRALALGSNTVRWTRNMSYGLFIY